MFPIFCPVFWLYGRSAILMAINLPWPIAEVFIFFSILFITKWKIPCMSWHHHRQYQYHTVELQRCQKWIAIIPLTVVLWRLNDFTYRFKEHLVHVNYYMLPLIISIVINLKRQEKRMLKKIEEIIVYLVRVQEEKP